MEIDEIDIKILNILKENSRISFTEIAKNLNITRQTVKSRIERLEKDGIIKRYTIEVADIFRKNLFILRVRTEDYRRLKDIEEVLEINKISDREYILKLEISSLSRLSEIAEQDWIEVEEVIPVLKSEIVDKPLSLKLEFKCDYCGKTSIDDPLIYKKHNRFYVLCCKTCLEEFKKYG
ncbi:Transcriptional regulator [Archaeoglobus sulfaticallidus PM70-1]|uniref:Transcriptional regulator n=1 Tax=Archaeoglobus sulfaticallidus PM70-1 TaxID=387631 RepID=N0BFX2_9EURY|nr:winged helix-turn-helix transcriptional regulator [Archaeoglobus sulfaticallidus]AGK61197.1 Transcriptional regulator [Archaeoglobus sulfaticallidus PM70-1]